MTTREKLHRLVDELSEPELESLLEFVVSRRSDPVSAVLDNAPEDDEPLTDEDEAAIAAAEGDVAAGRTISLDEFKRAEHARSARS